MPFQMWPLCHFAGVSRHTRYCDTGFCNRGKYVRLEVWIVQWRLYRWSDHLSVTWLLLLFRTECRYSQPKSTRGQYSNLEKKKEKQALQKWTTVIVSERFDLYVSVSVFTDIIPNFYIKIQPARLWLLTSLPNLSFLIQGILLAITLADTTNCDSGMNENE